MTTHYDTLEINYKATPEEIKAAYRKLVLKYHPDKNAGDKEMAAMFRKVKAAYEVLKNEESKRDYDLLNFQSFNRDSFSGNGFFDDFKDAFSRSDRFRRGGYTDERKNDIYIEQEFTLEEVALGAKNKFLQYDQKQICDVCHGKDFVKCENCSGTGIITIPKTVIADFPPGADGKHTFTMQGLGNNAIGSDKPGDLIIKCIIKTHPQFRTNSFNLDTHYILEVDLLDLLIKDKFEVPTIYGGESEKIKVTITDVIDGKEYIFHGKGLPMWNNISHKGDLVIGLKVITRRNIKPEKKEFAKKLIERLKKMYDKDSN